MVALDRSERNYKSMKKHVFRRFMTTLFFIIGIVIYMKYKLKQLWEPVLQDMSLDEYEVYYNACE